MAVVETERPAKEVGTTEAKNSPLETDLAQIFTSDQEKTILSAAKYWLRAKVSGQVGEEKVVEFLKGEEKAFLSAPRDDLEGKTPLEVIGIQVNYEVAQYRVKNPPKHLASTRPIKQTRRRSSEDPW